MSLNEIDELTVRQYRSKLFNVFNYNSFIAGGKVELQDDQDKRNDLLDFIEMKKKQGWFKNV